MPPRGMGEGGQGAGQSPLPLGGGESRWGCRGRTRGSNQSVARISALPGSNPTIIIAKQRCGARTWPAILLANRMLWGSAIGTGEQTAFADQLSGARLLALLKAGGNVIFIRHAVTEKDFADPVSAR